ncbi:MAG: response regulator [Bryobacteraceae bacterium]|nr:response regulator [Bryobacteraceae bacterium]
MTPEAVTPLSHLRHDLRTALHHVLGYGEILADATAESGDQAFSSTLHDIRAEAQSVFLMVESCLSGADETNSPQERLTELQTQVREPLQRLVRLSASLAHQSTDDSLHYALRIGAAASRLITMITLSTTPLADTRGDTAPAPAEVPKSMPGARLLIVDDDEANRDILSRTLSLQGYRAETAETGEEALRSLRRHDFDLVLLDVHMPEMDGTAVLAEMQKDERMRQVPVVMISAFDEMANVVSCIQAGAVDYLFKPFNPVLMRARLAATLERKRLLDSERARARKLETLSDDLRRSNVDLERFAWAVSHDLQSPLRTMVGFMQLVQRRAKDRLEPELLRLIDDAVGAGKRMSELVKDLLDYSQLSTRKIYSELVPLHDVAKEVLADLSTQIEESGAKVTVGEMPTILADRVQLRQLLQNLISNAVKYRSPEREPAVSVTAHRLGAMWELAVSDNGIGIRTQDIPTIFEMFRRLHGPDVPGSGIGLATCQRIMERLGGEITVESQEGKGSTFRIRVPAREVPHQAA